MISPHSQTSALTQTLIAGLQAYFDRTLGATLLYRFERAQYAEMRKRYVTGQGVKVAEEKEMRAIYGAEHLCRLLGESVGMNPKFGFVSRPFMAYSQPAYHGQVYEHG